MLLGERLPQPPKDVPLLPDDEAATQGLTVRQLVEKHTSDPKCAVCHRRIDPFGFALEAFDAIGRHRDKDLGDRPIDTQRQSDGRHRIRRPRRPAKLPAHQAARRLSATILPQSCSATPWAERCNSPTSRCWPKCRANLTANDYQMDRRPSRRSSAADSSARSAERKPRLTIEVIKLSHRFEPALNESDRYEQSQILPPHDASRPRRLDGAAVAGIAHRLGRRARGADSRERSARAAGRALRRQRLSQQGMVGQGRRQGDGAGPGARAAGRLREKMLFIRGLYNEEALKGNIHSSQTGNLLSGAPLASGGEIRSGTSIDQLLAQTLRPLDQGAEPRAGLREVEPVGPQELLDALQLAHLVESPTTPTPLELYPALAFDRLFKDEVQRGDKSVLDAVLADASDLRRRISTTDQRKLDEYLDSVRDVEQRIENAGKQGELQGWRPTLDKPNIPRPPDGIPQNIADHMRLMCDILVLGFQTDTTRITHAQAEQRSLVAPLPAPGRRLHDPPPAVALRHGRLAEGEPVLPRATRLHRPQARRDSGRRADAAR